MLLQPLRWRCIDCVIHHERDVREEQKYICMARASNNNRDPPQCEALRTCCLGFPIATMLYFYDEFLILKGTTASLRNCHHIVFQKQLYRNEQLMILS